MGKKLIELTDENFEKEVIKSSVPVVVDFYADWCAPCKMMSPTLEVINEEMRGNVKVAKVDVEKSSIYDKYSVSNLPTILLFENGEVVDRKVGVLDKKSLLKFASRNNNEE